jgi:hypothetical protein
MLQAKDIKKLRLVWWTRESGPWPGRVDWDVPCLVVKVDRQRNVFQVVSFDTFDTSPSLDIERPDKKTVLPEMYSCSLGDAIRFLLKRAPKHVPKERLNFLRS